MRCRVALLEFGMTRGILGVAKVDKKFSHEITEQDQRIEDQGK